MDVLLLLLEYRNCYDILCLMSIEPTRRNVDPSVAAHCCRRATGELIGMKHGNSGLLTRREKNCHMRISFCWQPCCKLVWIWMGRRDLRHMLAIQWRETSQKHCRAADRLSYWAPLLSRVIYIRGDSERYCASVCMCVFVRKTGALLMTRVMPWLGARVNNT